jgi:uncharacterized protein YecE (DUF72 family)
VVGQGAWDERYNYRYTQEELLPYAEFIKSKKQAPKTTTHVFFNNHFRGNAVVNALQMKLMLGEAIGETLPASFKEAFPMLDTTP